MPLAEGQLQLRGLVMGPGTSYKLAAELNPWSRTVRADQGAKRVWGHGSWSGAEWMDEAVVPIRLITLAADTAAWLVLHQQLTEAFAPSHEDLQLRFVRGGNEYLMTGRPRVIEPEVQYIGQGVSAAQLAFVATDPLIYSGEEHSVQIGLPSALGGLTVPITAPVTVTATITAGRALLTNRGTAPTGVRLRIDGSVESPQVALVAPDGTKTLRSWVTLDSAQWLDIDTNARTVLLNGTASRRGQTSGDWLSLPKGTTEVAFAANSYDPLASLTVAWHDAWY